MSNPVGVTRIIAQSVNSASLLVDNVSKTVTMSSPGLILFVVFLKDTTKEDLKRAVSEIISAKVFPLQHNINVWREQKGGDQTVSSERPKPVSLQECSDANLMIIPQATLAGKLKSKSVQYHGQCDKNDAEMLFYDFCQQLREGLDAAYLCDKNGVPLESHSGRVILNGTFGNRQGLDFSSGGPFTHIFDL